MIAFPDFVDLLVVLLWLPAIEGEQKRNCRGFRGLGSTTPCRRAPLWERLQLRVRASAPSLQGKGWEGCPTAPVEIRSTDCRIRTAMGFAALYPSYELTWELGSRSPRYRPSVRVGRASRHAGHGWTARESGQEEHGLVARTRSDERAVGKEGIRPCK